MPETWYAAEYRSDRPRPVWRRVGSGFIEVKEGNAYRYVTDEQFAREFVVDGKVDGA